ncbi:MAG: AraC family ligand binding domain-containing protein, partial [Planctomycetota bacterium]|nr:AraC family ligand binding domain-containing protein [Planctomycetota bacterium]
MDLRDINSIGDQTVERLVSHRVCPELRPLGLGTVGTSFAQPGFEFVRRRSNIGHILACVDGEGEVLLAGQWCRLAPGEAYLSPTGCLHAYAARGTWQVVWAHVEVDAQANYGIEAGGPRVVVGLPTELPEVVRALDREVLGRNEA